MCDVALAHLPGKVQVNEMFDNIERAGEKKPTIPWRGVRMSLGADFSCPEGWLQLIRLRLVGLRRRNGICVRQGTCLFFLFCVILGEFIPVQILLDLTTHEAALRNFIKVWRWQRRFWGISSFWLRLRDEGWFVRICSLLLFWITIFIITAEIRITQSMPCGEKSKGVFRFALLCHFERQYNFTWLV